MTVERVPLARLKPAQWNPGLIRDSRFKELCRSIQSDPEFLWRRPVLAASDGTIYAGNMRYRAVQHLGWESVPAILEDVPDRLAKERALRDNNAWGEWVEQDLAELLADLQIQESDLELLGFDEHKLTAILDGAGMLGDRIVDPERVADEWQGMPEFDQPNAMPHRTLAVHFADDAAAQDFARLIGQELTEHTKFVWHPEQKPQRRLGEHYVSDES